MKSKKCVCLCDCKRRIRFDRYKSLYYEQELCMTCEMRINQIKSVLDTMKSLNDHFDIYFK